LNLRFTSKKQAIGKFCIYCYEFPPGKGEVRTALPRGNGTGGGAAELNSVSRPTSLAEGEIK